MSFPETAIAAACSNSQIWAACPNTGGVSWKKTIITVVGNDTVGIIAKVCTYLAQNQVNILDISQTIVQGYFNMMMVADTSASDKEIATLSKELAALGDEIGVVIHCQHEDIFNVMHRIWKESPGQLTFIKNVVRRRQFHYTWKEHIRYD